MISYLRILTNRYRAPLEIRICIDKYFSFILQELWQNIEIYISLLSTSLPIDRKTYYLNEYTDASKPSPSSQQFSKNTTLLQDHMKNEGEEANRLMSKIFMMRKSVLLDITVILRIKSILPP